MDTRIGSSRSGKQQAEGRRLPPLHLGTAVLVALVALLASNACGTDAAPGASLGAGPAASASQAAEGALQRNTAAWLRAATIQRVQGEASPDYDFVAADDGGGRAHNVAQGLDATLSSEGLLLRPDDPACATGRAAASGCWSVGLRLGAVERGGERATLASAPTTLADNRATLRHSPRIDEWYVNGPLGLEQGFVLAEAPGGAAAAGHGGIVIHLEVTGDLEPAQDAEGGAITLRTGAGDTVLHYTDLFAFDAADRPLPARLAVADDAIELRVDDRDAVYPVTIDPLIWTQMTKIVAGTLEDAAEFGIAVAVDGDTAIVGAWGEDVGGTDRGAAYIYYRNQNGTDSWGLVATLTANDGADGDYFGFDVDVEGDVAIVGANGKDDGGTDRGAAYVFYRNHNGNDQWGQVAKLTASDTADLDEFGAAVAVDGTTALVGAPSEDGTGSDRGAAYVFYRDHTGNDLWGEVVKVGASDDQNFDMYGCAVDLDGDIAIIGSNGDNSSGQETGAAYVLYRNNGSNDAWGEEKKIVALDKEGGDVFGSTVGIAGDTVVVGAPREDGAGSERGAAYVFQQNWGSTDNWGEVKKLVAGDTQNLDRFGTSVAIAGDSVFVGAPHEDGSGADRGAAYVFERNEGSQDNWGGTLKLLASDAANADEFGSSVAVTGGMSVGDSAVVGAPVEDGAGTDRGAAYVFSLKTPNGEYCGADTECVSGFCVDMMCCNTPCGGGDVTDCIACSQVADGPVDGQCLPRLNGSTCSDGAYCNGTESCTAGVCGSSTGDPCLPYLGDDDADCSESCDENNDLCIAVDPNGSACSDGSFCNGTEICTNGSCGNSTGDPCAANVGGLDSDCSESCNENADACTANDPDGSQCDDAVFCNGTDTCLGGACLTHAGNPCPGADNDADCTETCDDGDDDCEGNDPNGSPCPGGVCQVGVCTTSSGTGGGGGSSSSGTGGAGGGGGSSSSGTGGEAGGGGSSSSGTGGEAGAGGGGGTTSSSGSTSSGTGGTASSGTGGTGATTSGQPKLEPEGGGGCGCRVGGSRRSVPMAGWGALAALALAGLRRRRR